MNIKVITTEKFVYATYNKTICGKYSYTDFSTLETARNNAAAAAFFHGCSSPITRCNDVQLLSAVTDNDIFTYLEKTN